jgi:hypothetical protein
VALDRAADLARHHQDPMLLRWCVQELGILAREIGERSRAERYLGEALALAREAKDAAMVGIVLGNLATHHRYAGELPRAEALYREALQRHREVGNRRSELIVLGNLGHLAALAGDPEGALRAYREALALLEEIDDPRSLAIILLHLTGLEASRGSLDAAEWLARRAEAAAKELEDRPMEAAARAELGVLLAERGALAQARLAIAEARRIVAPFDPGGGWTQVIDLLDSLIDAGDPAVPPARPAAVLDALLEQERVSHHSAHSELLRQAAVRLGERLAKRTRGVQPVAPAPEPALSVARDGRWFQLAGAPRVDLERRRPLRRILALLVAERLAHPGRAVPLDAIITAGWPGERLIPRSANTRAYVALSTLRRLGLGEVLLRRGGGYLLAASAALDLSEAEI